MNINYFIGKTVKNGLNLIINYGPKFILKFIPKGNHYILDILKYSNFQKPSYLFDVGANIGQTCLYWQSFFKQTPIYSFEPIQTTFYELKKNTDPYKNINIFNHAFGKKAEEIAITLSSDSEQNSLINVSKNNIDISSPSEIVKVITLDEFSLKHKIPFIDVLKIDVEGFELEVLKGAQSLLETNKIKFI